MVKSKLPQNCNLSQIPWENVRNVAREGEIAVKIKLLPYFSITQVYFKIENGNRSTVIDHIPTYL